MVQEDDVAKEKAKTQSKLYAQCFATIGGKYENIKKKIPVHRV